VLQVLDLGATMHSLEVTCGDGVRRNVLLGHATPQEYLDSTDYLGGTIGRYELAQSLNCSTYVLQ